MPRTANWAEVFRDFVMCLDWEQRHLFVNKQGRCATDDKKKRVAELFDSTELLWGTEQPKDPPSTIVLANGPTPLHPPNTMSRKKRRVA